MNNSLPAGLTNYKQTPIFDQDSLPAGLRCKPASAFDADRRRNELIRIARHAIFLVNLLRRLTHLMANIPAGEGPEFFSVRFTVKKFRLGAGGQNYGVAPILVLQGLARVGDRS